MESSQMDSPDAALPEIPFTGPDFSGVQPTGLPVETRQVARRSYPFPQRYALYREERWPTDDEFLLAEMCDISPRGLALLLSHRPATSQLVVELGVGTNVSQSLVRVVQVTPLLVAGRQGYRVGCEFVSPKIEMK